MRVSTSCAGCRWTEESSRDSGRCLVGGLEPGETIEDGLRREVRLGPNRAVIGPGEIVRFCPGMGRVLSTKVSLAFASRQTSFLVPFSYADPTRIPHSVCARSPDLQRLLPLDSARPVPFGIELSRLTRDPHMDKATTIIGIDCSPRASSNSGRMLGEVLRSLERDRRVKVVEQVRLADERIDCLGCEQCYQTFGYHGDGIDRVLSLMKESDVILMATPTCFGMPPALGVVLLDRSDPLWRDGQQLKGKLGAVIVDGATDPADDPSVRQCADNMIKFFEQHEMPCVQPVHLGGTLAYPEQRFPDPLPAGTTGVLEQLADEIRQWVGGR
jgi:multimeric flavodoxin WrbA